MKIYEEIFSQSGKQHQSQCLSLIQPRCGLTRCSGLGYLATQMLGGAWESIFGSRCHSSSVRKGMNGERRRSARSAQLYKVWQVDWSRAGSPLLNMGFIDSCSLRKILQWFGVTAYFTWRLNFYESTNTVMIAYLLSPDYGKKLTENSQSITIKKLLKSEQLNPI